MYKLVATISILIRQFCIPNPFDKMEGSLTVSLGEMSMVCPPTVMNWVAEPFMHAVTFAAVGLYYDSGTAPAFGSVLYLLFYCVHTFMLWLMALARFAEWAIMFVVILYVVCHICFMKLMRIQV